MLPCPLSPHTSFSVQDILRLKRQDRLLPAGLSEAPGLPFSEAPAALMRKDPSLAQLHTFGGREAYRPGQEGKGAAEEQQPRRDGGTHPGKWGGGDWRHLGPARRLRRRERKTPRFSPPREAVEAPAFQRNANPPPPAILRGVEPN